MKIYEWISKKMIPGTAMMYNLEVMLQTIVYIIERKMSWRNDSMVKLQLSLARDVA
jgi:hypothetical protein